MQAQEPVSILLTEKDGLPDKEIYNIIEDSKGFIWIAADKGLFRYDGKDFTNFSNPEKRGLSVFEPFEDHLGRVWCTNISGQFFYTENNKLITFVDLSKQLKGVLSNFLVTEKYLVVFSNYNVFFVEIETKVIEEKYASNIDKAVQIGAPLSFKNKIYFGDLKNIQSLSEKGDVKPLIPFYDLFIDKEGKYNSTRKSKLFALGTSLFVRHHGIDKKTIFKLNIENASYTTVKGLEPINDFGHKFFFENNGKLWVGTNKGVYVFAYLDSAFVLEKHFLKDHYITKILKDKDDNFWLATLNNGLVIMPNIFIEQLNVVNKDKDITTLGKIDESNVFYGDNSGDIVFYNIKNNTQQITDLPTNDKVTALHYNTKRNNYIISKTENSYILKSNKNPYSIPSTISNSKSIVSIPNQGNLFGDDNNVFLFDFDNSKKLKQLKLYKRVYTLFYSKNYKKTYIAYVDGIKTYDLKWNEENLDYSKQIYGTAFTETQNNLVWVSTFKDGIYAIKDNKVTQHITTENGLLSNRIEHIKADQNNLWIATDNGIQIYNFVTKTFKNLTKTDGVISYNISGIEVFEEKVVFSSDKGLFSIDKRKAFKDRQLPKVYFNLFEINEQSRAFKDNYTLNHQENNIKIGFNVNGYLFNQKGKYKYRLLGSNDQWSILEARNNTVKYNSLPAGNYTFEVQAFLEAEHEESNMLTLKFKVKSPFWKTWWFRLGILCLIFGSMFWYFKRSQKEKDKLRKKQIKQLEIDKELTNLKLENLRSQMNPHFVFNALNSIQEYIFTNQKRLAGDYLGKFADLMRIYLDQSKRGKITLAEEIDTLEKYLTLEKLRFEDTLSYQINIDENIDVDDIYIPTMLIQPYAENALKHGLLHKKTDRKLTISIQKKATDLIECIVEDNGVGRKKTKELLKNRIKTHKSFGLKATKSRLDLLNSNRKNKIGVAIEDLYEADTATGTRVVLTIPII